MSPDPALDTRSSSPKHRSAHTGRDVALIDLLDRLLAGGVVLGGDIMLAAADIDLVRLDLRALISSVPPGGGGDWR